MTAKHPMRLISATPLEFVRTCSSVYTQNHRQVEGRPGAKVNRVEESTERWGWTTIGTILILLVLNPTVKSPDGLEMLRLTGQWLGHPTTVGDPYFWPPLWSALNIPAVALGQPVIGAHLLNQLLWGFTIWPLR